MKIRLLVSISIFIFAVCIISGSCATRKKVISEDEFIDVWAGTWINMDYPGDEVIAQKLISHPNGTQDFYLKASS